MLTISEFRIRARLEEHRLISWVEAGWLVPSDENGEPRYSELDVARAELIHDLQHELGVNDEGIGVVLDLLDQIHGLRASMNELMKVLCAQPPDIRERLVAEARKFQRDGRS
ncbi:chaperone modulator CbpM [Rhodoligotrophos ferricapiens]|uniref:chaperone modulator CbpM n=1 Tax=Rhodoligotrophos ferricapiens TaxID=3069264 RepID=UPI00315CCBFD